MNDFWAIILAAGESKRMGSPKMLLPFNGKTMIETVITNVSQSHGHKYTGSSWCRKSKDC